MDAEKKLIKPGVICLVLQGRFAGKKAVVLQRVELSGRAGSYALVAGVRTPPRKVTAEMDSKRAYRRSTLRPFIKVMNLSHLMPTRFNCESSDLVKDVTVDAVRDKAAKDKAMSIVGKRFRDRYLAGNDPWLFQKLAF